MPKLNEIVEGNLNNITQETIDENSIYSILDFPTGGITNAQMTAALTAEQRGFYKPGDVFHCIDNGTYTFKHIYEFVVNSGVASWLDITPQSTITKTDISDNGGLVTPDTAPGVDKIIAIDSTGAQTNLTLGEGLTIENGVIKASGGQLYEHIISFNITPSSTTHSTRCSLTLIDNYTIAYTSQTFKNSHKSKTYGISGGSNSGKKILIFTQLEIDDSGNMFPVVESLTFDFENQSISWGGKTSGGSVSFVSDTVTPL